MSTIRRQKKEAHKSGITPHIRQLIDSVGGQTSFIRNVWCEPVPSTESERKKLERLERDRETINRMKGKVGKWYHGRAGIRLTEAKHIAEMLDVSIDEVVNGKREPDAMPWNPSHWTRRTRLAFAIDFFRASAYEHFNKRSADIETIERLSKSDDRVDVENAIGDRVDLLAVEWMGEVHEKVREVVADEIVTRLAKFVQLARRKAG